MLSSARNTENAVSEMRTCGCCQRSTLITVQAKKRLRSQTLTLLIKRNGKIELIRNMDLNWTYLHQDFLCRQLLSRPSCIPFYWTERPREALCCHPRLLRLHYYYKSTRNGKLKILVLVLLIATLFSSQTHTYKRGRLSRDWKVITMYQINSTWPSQSTSPPKRFHLDSHPEGFCL